MNDNSHFEWTLERQSKYVGTVWKSLKLAVTPFY